MQLRGDQVDCVGGGLKQQKQIGGAELTQRLVERNARRECNLARQVCLRERTSKRRRRSVLSGTDEAELDPVAFDLPVVDQSTQCVKKRPRIPKIGVDAAGMDDDESFIA